MWLVERSGFGLNELLCGDCNKPPLPPRACSCHPKARFSGRQPCDPIRRLYRDCWMADLRGQGATRSCGHLIRVAAGAHDRSEARRVGKEGVSECILMWLQVD